MAPAPDTPQCAPSGAVFLDRDGVIVEPVPDPGEGGRAESPLRTSDTRLLEGAADAIKALLDQGFLVIVASNQPAAAKGKIAPGELEAIHERVVSLLAEQGVTIADWRYCLHQAQDRCGCRKPAPGLLLDAATAHDIDLARSWMVGDADTDTEAGIRAGCRTALIEHPLTGHRRGGGPVPDLRVDDLGGAVREILLDAPSCRRHD